MDKPYHHLALHSSEEIEPLRGGESSSLGMTPTKKLRILDPVRVLSLVVFLQATLLIVGFAFYRSQAYNCSTTGTSTMFTSTKLYTPAQDIIRDKVKVFDTGIGHKTIYQGEGPEVDQAWEDLYDLTTIKISREEAKQLPNQTWPIDYEPGYYIAQLDVFHQLHCVNMLRRFIQNRTDEHHNPQNAGWHLSHCVESLRQSIMCHTDISVMVWQWSEREQRVFGKLEYPHMCRNFEEVRDWSRARRIGKYIDVNRFIENDLPTPPIIYG